MQDFYCLFCTEETNHIIKTTIDDAEMWVCEDCYNAGIYKEVIR